MSASDVIRRLQPELTKVAGITLYMQPVQDLTVEDRVSRTQYQYTLEDPNADELNSFVPKMVARLQEIPELRDVATDQQVNGLRVKVVFDRDTASRLGITPTAIDNTLYDAYGQREVSTMFTQLNQYHVVLEVKPGFQNNPVDLRNLFIRSAAGLRRQRGGVGRIGEYGGFRTLQRVGGAGHGGPVDRRSGRRVVQRGFQRRPLGVVAGFHQRRRPGAVERVHACGAASRFRLR